MHFAIVIYKPRKGLAVVKRKNTIIADAMQKTKLNYILNNQYDGNMLLKY